MLSIEATGYFSSSEVHCAQGCQKHHRHGRVTYYPQVLGAVLVHPQQGDVLPFAAEAIMQQDGHSKNDGERNAAKRLLNTLRREHPPMKLIVIEDALASNAPPIRLLKELNLRFIPGAKQGEHPFLFDGVDNTKKVETHEVMDDNGVLHRFPYLIRPH